MTDAPHESEAERNAEDEQQGEEREAEDPDEQASGGAEQQQEPSDPQHRGRDTEPPRERDDEHLRNIEDGAGCTEIWEHLSENRGTDA